MNVYFKINFEGLTQRIREYWAEGSYSLALSIMVESGIPIGDAHNIIRGKLKMVQDPNGVEGVSGILVDDDWQPNLGICYMGKYPDPEDYQWFRLIYRYGTEGLVELHSLAEWAVNTMNNSIYSLDKIRILQEVKKVPEEIFEYFDLPDPRTIHTSELYKPELNLDSVDFSTHEAAKDIRHLPGLPSVDQYIKRELELQKLPKPKPDKKFSQPTGAITPDGKFYSCGWMEHSWLTDAVANLTVEGARKQGWVMITHPMDLPTKYQIFYGDKELTQKQIDTLFDWKQKWGEAEIIGDF